MFLLFIVIYPDLSWFFHACLNFTSNMTDQLVVGKLCVESNRQHDPALKEYDMKHANVAQLWMYIYLALGHRSSFTSHNTQKLSDKHLLNTTDYQHEMPLWKKTLQITNIKCHFYQKHLQCCLCCFFFESTPPSEISNTSDTHRGKTAAEGPERSSFPPGTHKSQRSGGKMERGQGKWRWLVRTGKKQTICNTHIYIYINIYIYICNYICKNSRYLYNDRWFVSNIYLCLIYWFTCLFL